MPLVLTMHRTRVRTAFAATAPQSPEPVPEHRPFGCVVAATRAATGRHRERNALATPVTSATAAHRVDGAGARTRARAAR